MNYCLVAIDVTGIQRYLFGSNNLKENIGASEIVAQATEQWVFECLQGFKHNFKFTETFNWSEADWFTAETIETGLEAEVIFAGGGNAVIIFAAEANAKTFTQNLSRKAIAEAPGLNMVIAHHPFSWDTSLPVAYEDLIKELARQKARHQPSAPLLGLSVTATCQSTGLPAIDFDSDDTTYRISAETRAKLHYEQEKADKRMAQLLPSEAKNSKFVQNFSMLGHGENSSYMAVVHADGNSISQHIEAAVKGCQSNREFIQIRREFSQGLRKGAIAAMKELIAHVIAGVKTKKISFADDYRLPLRPLIIGGDDTTFVCDGQVGLSLAKLYLDAFHKHTQGLPACAGLHACAGVAIVHNHFPFARAYQLSDACIKEAKAHVRKNKRNNESSFSAIDWHFGINGLIEDLTVIRQQEFTVKAGKLQLRPLRLTESAHKLDQPHSWQTFYKVITALQRGKWLESRNKLKKLREVLRDGPEATQQFIQTYLQPHGLVLPEMPLESEVFQTTGWRGDICGYFDAIEAIDYFVDLEAKQDEL